MSEVPIINNLNFENNNNQQQQMNELNSRNENNENNNDNNNNNNIQNINNININNDDLNESIKSNNQNENNLASPREWIKYFKDSKINLEEINKLLLSNVESIDNENIKLKDALCELIKDLKEKEKSLDESLKIISKLKSNYSTLFHQYQNLEKKYAKLNEENEFLKKDNDTSNRNRSISDGINKKNDYLKDEINKIRKDNQILKNNYNMKNNECMRLNKEMNELKLLIEDLKQRNLDYLSMIKDREKIILEYTNQIRNMNHEINNKNEQLKILVKFSKSINDNNKINVKELTKQACQTIKLLYNYNQNNNNTDNIKHDNCMNNIIKILFNSKDLDDLNNFNLNEANVKITFKLKEAIQDNLLLDNNDKVINISKDFLFDIIIKFHLLKIELFSSLLREFHFVDFLNNLMAKLNIKDFNIKNFINKINEIIKKNNILMRKNDELKKKIINLVNKIDQLNLYIEKLQKEIQFGKYNIQQKINQIMTLFKIKSNELKIVKIYNNNSNEKTKDKPQTNRKRKLKPKQKNLSINNDDEDEDSNNNNNNFNFSYNNNKYHNINDNISNKRRQSFKSLQFENIISFYIDKSYNNNNNINHINNINNNNNSYKIENNPKIFDFSQAYNNSNNNDYNNNVKNSSNTNSSNTLTFQQKEPINKLKTINESFNEKNYQQKRIENDKLKEEISYLKNEIKDLLQDINKQQKIFYEKNNEKNNNKKKNNNAKCDKCEYINNYILTSSIPDSHKLIEIKNIILSSPSFDENIKTIINAIFDVIVIILTNDYIVKNHHFHSITSIKNIKNVNRNSKNINANFNKENNFNELFYTELNIKIFSSSELKKYQIIYNENNNNINDLIDIYIKRVDDIKNNISSLKLFYDTSISSNINEDINYYDNKRKNINQSDININCCKPEELGSEYKDIHEEILKLKNEKVIIDNLIELIKNYLIINEKIFQYYMVDNKNIDKYKKYLNKIFTIFKDCCYYNIDDISDNNIFYRKLIIKLFEISFLHS